VPLDEQLIVRIPLHADGAEEIAGLLREQRPTAIFAANNLLAEAAWYTLRRSGLKIPKDVSLVGFDDVPWMQMVDPELTVVAQPAFEMGRRAAKLLLARLDDPGRAPTAETLQPTLVVRGSTAQIPA